MRQLLSSPCREEHGCSCTHGNDVTAAAGTGTVHKFQTCTYTTPVNAGLQVETTGITAHGFLRHKKYIYICTEGGIDTDAGQGG